MIHTSLLLAPGGFMHTYRSYKRASNLDYIQLLNCRDRKGYRPNPDTHPLVCRCGGHTQNEERGGRGAAGIPCGGPGKAITSGKASCDTGGDMCWSTVCIRRTPRVCSATDLRAISSCAVSCHSCILGRCPILFQSRQQNQSSGRYRRLLCTGTE